MPARSYWRSRSSRVAACGALPPRGAHRQLQTPLHGAGAPSLFLPWLGLQPACHHREVRVRRFPPTDLPAPTPKFDTVEGHNVDRYYPAYYITRVAVYVGQESWSHKRV